MQIVAYKCVDTGEIFEDLSKFEQHRLNVMGQQLAKAQLQEQIRSVEQSLDRLKAEATHISEIEQWIQDNGQTLAQFARHQPTHPLPNANFKITHVRLNVSWNLMCSNSHCAPRGGVQNWIRDPLKPRGYPGWCGRADFLFEGTYTSFFSKLFENTSIHLGSGGGGLKSYGCGVTLFASDWPGLYSEQTVKGLLENL